MPQISMDAWVKSGTKSQGSSASHSVPSSSQGTSSQPGRSPANKWAPGSDAGRSSSEPMSSQEQQEAAPPPPDYGFTMRYAAEQDGTRWMTDQPAIHSAPGVGAASRSSSSLEAGGGSGTSAGAPSPRSGGGGRGARLVSQAAAMQAEKQRMQRKHSLHPASSQGGVRGGPSPSVESDSSVTCLVCHFSAQGRPAPKAKAAGQQRLSRPARDVLGKFKSVTLGRSTSTKAERRVPLHEGCISSCVNMGLRLDEQGVPHHVLSTLRKLRKFVCSRCGCPGATVTAAGTLHTEATLQPSPKGTPPKLYHVPCAVEIKVAEQRLLSSTSSARSSADSGTSRKLFQGGSGGGAGGIGTAKHTSALAPVTPSDDSAAAWVARSKMASAQRAAAHAAGRSATAALLKEDGPALQLNRALKARKAAEDIRTAEIAALLQEYVPTIGAFLAHSGVQAALASLEGVVSRLPTVRAQRVLKAATPAACIKALSMPGGSVGAISASVGLPQLEALKLMSLQSGLARCEGDTTSAAQPSVLPIPEHAYANGLVPRPDEGIDLVSFPRERLPAALAAEVLDATKNMLKQLYDSAGLNKAVKHEASPACSAAAGKPAISPGRQVEHTRNSAPSPAGSAGASTPVRNTPTHQAAIGTPAGTPSAGGGGVPSQWSTPARRTAAGAGSSSGAVSLVSALNGFPKGTTASAVTLNSARHPPPSSPGPTLSASQAAIAEQHGLFLNTECGPAALLELNKSPPHPKILPPAKVRAPSDSDVATMPMVEEIGRLLQRLHPSDARFPISSACTNSPAQRFYPLLNAASSAALHLCSAMQHAAVHAAHPDHAQTAHALAGFTPPAPRSRWGGGVIPESLPQEPPLREALQAMQARAAFVAGVAGVPHLHPREVATTAAILTRWEQLVTASRRRGLGPLGTALTSVSASSVAAFAEADSPSRAARTSFSSTPNSARARKQRQARLSLSFGSDGSTVMNSAHSGSPVASSGTPSTLDKSFGASPVAASGTPPSASPEGGESLDDFECWQEAAEEVAAFASLVDAWAAWVPLDCAVNAGLRRFAGGAVPPPNTPLAVLEGMPTDAPHARARIAVLAAACAPGVHPAALKCILSHWTADAADAAVATGERRGAVGTLPEQPRRVPPMSDAEVLCALTLTDAAAERVEGARMAAGGGLMKPKGRESTARKRHRETRNAVVHRPVAREVFVLEHAVAPTSALGAYVVGRDLQRQLVEWNTMSTGACVALRQLIVDMHTLGKPPNSGVSRLATKLVRFAPSHLALDASHRLLHGSASLFPSHVTHHTTVVASPGSPLAMVFDMVMPLVPHLVFPEVFPVGLLPPPASSQGGCHGQAPTVLVALAVAPEPTVHVMDSSHPSSSLLGLGDCSMHKLDLAVGRISFAAWGAGTLLRDAKFWSEQYRRFAQETLMGYESQLDRLVESLQGSSSFGSGTPFCDAAWLVVPPWTPHTRIYSALHNCDSRMWRALCGDDDEMEPEHAAARVFGSEQLGEPAALLQPTKWLGIYHCMKIQAVACSLVDMICAVFREHAVPRWAPVDPSGACGAALWERLKHLNLQSMRVAGEWLGALGMIVPLSRGFVHAIVRSIRALPSALHENMLMSAWPQCPMKRAVQAALQAPAGGAGHSVAPTMSSSGAVLDVSGSSTVVNLAESQDEEEEEGDLSAYGAAGQPNATWNSVAGAADDCSNLVATSGLQWHQMLQIVLRASCSL